MITRRIIIKNPIKKLYTRIHTCVTNKSYKKLYLNTFEKKFQNILKFYYKNIRNILELEFKNIIT